MEEGTTIRQLLDDLAGRYSPVARHVFDRKVKSVYPEIFVIYNDRVISPHVVHEQVLGDGDKITVLPVPIGG